MSTKAKKQSKISWYIKAPVRALCKARDFYVRSLTNCAGNIGNGGAAYGGAPLPKSFSVNSSVLSNNEADYRELIRASSSKSLDDGSSTTVSVVPRSQTVSIWRIDEDKPFDDQFEDVKVNSSDVLSRSRSYAVSRKPRKM